ncbi:hypothetical protein TMatcc_000923 [Talaromyces marneffei ATCC 18224]
MAVVAGRTDLAEAKKFFFSIHRLELHTDRNTAERHEQHGLGIEPLWFCHMVMIMPNSDVHIPLDSNALMSRTLLLDRPRGPVMLTLNLQRTCYSRTSSYSR